MPAITFDPPPYDGSITNEKFYTLGPQFIRWFGQLFGIIQAAAIRLGSTLVLTNRNAAIATTPIPLPALGGGPYRLTGILQVTAVDGVSSSVGLVFGWTNGVSLTKTFTPLTGDTLTTTDSFTVTVPTTSSVLTYATSYASNTPNKMKYLLEITVESI